MSNTRILQLQEFLSEDPSDSFSSYALALEYQKAGELEMAVLQMELLRSMDPDYLPLYYQLGGFYKEQKNLIAAEGVLREGIMLAEAQKNKHTLAELKQSLSDIVEDDFWFPLIYPFSDAETDKSHFNPYFCLPV